MEDGRCIAKEGQITLTTPQAAPFSFTVAVRDVGAISSPTRSFQIAGIDPSIGSIKTREYRVDREHNSYIDFFECLSRDFGLRLPNNRRPRAEHTFRASYRALLTENIAPGILYGYGDPAVLRVQKEFDAKGVWYYLVATSNDAPDSFPILRSHNLIDWEFVGFVFPQGRKPRWAADGEFVSDYWAPEMHKVGSEFRVYFVARDKKDRSLCIGLAKSSLPDGPFIAGERPVLEGNVIDPHIFVTGNDSSLLYWKEDNNGVWPSRLNDLLYNHPRFAAELFDRKEDQITASFLQAMWPWVRTLEPMERFFIQQVLIEAVTSKFLRFHERLEKLLDSHSDAGVQNDIRAVLQAMRTTMYAQRLSPDGSRLVGERTKIIQNDQEWEAHLVEGMWVTKHQGRYYLFYAGNDFSTDQYGIGVAVGDSPLGPYRKMPAPLLRSTADWSGPGHPSVAVGPDGKPMLFFHAYFPGKTGYKQFRALLSAPITLEDDRVLLR